MFIRQSSRERWNDKDSFSIYISVFKWLQWPGLHQDKAKRQKVYLSLPSGWQHPVLWPSSAALLDLVAQGWFTSGAAGTQNSTPMWEANKCYKQWLNPQPHRASLWWRVYFFVVKVCILKCFSKGYNTAIKIRKPTWSQCFSICRSQSHCLLS